MVLLVFLDSSAIKVSFNWIRLSAFSKSSFSAWFSVSCPLILLNSSSTFFAWSSNRFVKLSISSFRAIILRSATMFDSRRSLIFCSSSPFCFSRTSTFSFEFLYFCISLSFLLELSCKFLFSSFALCMRFPISVFFSIILVLWSCNSLWIFSLSLSFSLCCFSSMSDNLSE